MHSGQKNSSKKSRLYTNPGVLIIAFNSMAVSIAFGIIQPSLAFYLLALEGAITEPPGPGYTIPEEAVASFAVVLGIMMAAFMGTRTLLARFWGDLSDVRGRKPIIVVGLFGYVILMALWGMARSWIELVLVRGLHGVVSAAVWPVGEAALIDIIGEKRRGEGMGLYIMATQIGWITGPGLGGLLYNFCRDSLKLLVPDVFRVPYFIAALIILPMPLLTIQFLKESAERRIIHSPITNKASSGKGDGIIPSTLDVPSQNSKMTKMTRTLYVMNFMNGLSMGLAMPLFQLFVMSKITSDIATIGFMITGAGSIGLLMNLPAGWLSDRYGRKPLALWSGVLSRGCMAGLPLTKTVPQTSLIYIGRSAAFAVSQPVMSAIQGDIVPPRIRGKVFGTIQAFFNGGATLGPIMGGWIFSKTSLLSWKIRQMTLEGIVTPFWIGAVLGLVGLVLFAKNIIETRPPNKSETFR